MGILTSSWLFMTTGLLLASLCACVVFLGKTLYSHSASLHPGVQMGTSEFNAGGSPVMD